jgi:hypothetical protein
MKRMTGIGLLAAALVAGLSCDDGIGPFAPGTLVVRLTSPHPGADSAIVFTISGPEPLTSAVPGSGLELFQPVLTGTSTKFALIGQLNDNAVLMTVGIRDVARFRLYTGTINGIAQPNFQLRDTKGYALALTR